MAKQRKSWLGDRERALVAALMALDTAEEHERFLLDLCTPAELTAMADRWSVAQLLDREVPYRQIHDEIGVSTATVTRVARALVYGDNGYRVALDKVRDKSRKKEVRRA
jgi:TrpR-related protein YerC/YecD